MKAAEVLAINDIPAGICPGCGIRAALPIAYFGRLQQLFVCSGNCWDQNFASKLGDVGTPPTSVARLSCDECGRRVSVLAGGSVGVSRAGGLSKLCGKCRGVPETSPPFVIRSTFLGIDADELRDAIEAVAAAWNDSGRAPRVHAAAKTHLRANWRTLANTVERLARLLK